MKIKELLVAILTILLSFSLYASDKSSFRGFSIGMGNKELSTILKNESQKYLLFVEVIERSNVNDNSADLYLLSAEATINETPSTYSWGLADLIVSYERPIVLDLIYNDNKSLVVYRSPNEKDRSRLQRYVGDVQLPPFKVTGIEFKPKFFDAEDITAKEMMLSIIENFSFDSELFDPDEKNIRCGNCVAGLLDTGELLILKVGNTDYDWRVTVREPTDSEFKRIKGSKSPMFN